MDFKKPKKAVVVQLLCIVATILVGIFYQLLYMLRLYIYYKTSRGKDDNASKPSTDNPKQKNLPITSMP